jgi:SAM-dependent methyltransferase
MKLKDYHPPEILFHVITALQSGEPLKRALHFVLACILYSLPITFRKVIFKGKNRHCPICQSDIRSFLKLHRSHHLWCPICRSLQRHRLAWIFLNSSDVQLYGTPKSFLHIGPEPALSERLQRIYNLKYVSADLNNSKARVKMDICYIPFPPNSFDIIFCSHVLEHVTNDRQAIQEFFRVLKPQGKAFLMVPIISQSTFEDLSIHDPFERLRLFGQHDHVRKYGYDFIKRLENANFLVKITTVESLVQYDQMIFWGLNRKENIFICEKPF